MIRHLPSLIALAVATASVPAAAGVVFDSQALGEPHCATDFCFTETRGSDENYAAVLKFSSDVTVNKIGVFSSVDDAQNVKFLIFDSALNGGTGNLLFSQTKAFAATPQQFLYTDAMSFTFQAGHTYDVGILGDGVSLTGRWIVSNISNPLVTEISNNANFFSYASPTTGGYAGVSPYVQLQTAVPEPATWALLVGGFGLVGLARRRQSAVAA